MIVKSEMTPAGFTKCSITITFETQDELDMFGSVFNTSSIAKEIRNLSSLDPSIIYNCIGNLGGNVDRFTASLNNGSLRYRL